MKLGQRLTDALRGGPPFAWTPYLLLWTGLAAGATAGAWAHARIGLAAIWLAATAMAALALLMWRMPKGD